MHVLQMPSEMVQKRNQQKILYHALLNFDG